MAALASDWLRHFRLLLWNRWTEFNETWQEARSQRPLPSLCFSGRSEKQDGRPGLWLAETFSTSLKPLNGIQRNLTGSKISTSSTKFVFFGPIRKTRWPPWPLIGWDIFNFSSETSAGNSTKLNRKQDLNVLYQVCVFGADLKNRMAALTPDWLRHLRLRLWNRWKEFNETWQEARSQRLLPSLCFSGRWVNKNFRPGWSVKKVAHCTQVHDMWPCGPLVAFYAPLPKKSAGEYSNLIVHVSVSLSVILSCQHLKCNILSLGGDAVTKLGLWIHSRVAHTKCTSHAPRGRAGQILGLRFCQILTLLPLRVSVFHKHIL